MLRTTHQQDSFRQVVNGTPSSAATPPPDYEIIINNRYDPLNQSLEVEDSSVSTNLNPEDAILVDNDEDTLNLDASQHDIDEHYCQQDQIQMQLEQPSLDPEGEEDYEDEDHFAKLGQANDDETMKLAEQRSKQLWHQRLPTTVPTPPSENSELRIIRLADQVSRDAITVSEDRIKVEEQAALVLADKNQIKKAASAFSKRERLIEEAEARLFDQAQAITIKGTKIDAKLTETTTLLASLEEKMNKGDTIIRTITSLQTTEQVVQGAFKRIKKYANKMELNLAAPTQLLPSRDDITDIKTKLDKMKQFARTTVDIVRQAGEKQIAAIKSSTGEVFLEQNAIYHERMNEIKDTCTATLDNQKILLQQGMEKFTTDRTTLLHSLDKKVTSANSIH